MASGSPWRTHREPSGRPVGLAEGGGRGGHPDQNHVEEYRSANAYVQAVFKNGHTKIAYVTKNGPLQGVSRLHGMV